MATKRTAEETAGTTGTEAAPTDQELFEADGGKTSTVTNQGTDGAEIGDDYVKASLEDLTTRTTLQANGAPEGTLDIPSGSRPDSDRKTAE